MSELPASSTARMRALLKAAVDGIVSIDQRGLIESFNQAAQDMFGYTEGEVVGRNISLLMPAPYAEEHDGYIANYLKTGVRKIIGIGREVKGKRKDGSTFPMDLSVAEAAVGNEKIFVGIIRDITGRKQAELALQQSKQELEEAVTQLRKKNEEINTMAQQLWLAAKLASVGELAASIAHELNNPLATVSLRVESLLNRTPPDDPKRRALEIVKQESKRMGDLVANLLQFTRRGKEQVSTVDIISELTQAVELVQHLLRKRRIEVMQKFAADTPMIFADRQKLRQVFLNLLTNASDAMENGGALTLRAESAFDAEGHASVLIEFVDTGAGIPEEHLARVLEPFFTTKEEGKGTGLGLSICRRIIQEHGGSLHISSEFGKGTTVSIILPVRKNGHNVNELRSQV